MTPTQISAMQTVSDDSQYKIFVSMKDLDEFTQAGKLYSEQKEELDDKRRRLVSAEQSRDEFCESLRAYTNNVEELQRQLATQTREHDTRILSMQREFDSKLNIATSRCDEAVMQAQNGSQQLETVRRELEESKVKCEGFWLGLKQ